MSRRVFGWSQRAGYVDATAMVEALDRADAAARAAVDALRAAVDAYCHPWRKYGRVRLWLMRHVRCGHYRYSSTTGECFGCGRRRG